VRHFASRLSASQDRRISPPEAKDLRTLLPRPAIFCRFERQVFSGSRQFKCSSNQGSEETLMPIRSLYPLLFVVVLSCAGLQFSTSAWSKTETACGAPIAADDGWQAASPGPAGADGARFCPLDEILDKSPPLNVHSIVVARGGKLVYETYRTGFDQNWGTRLGTVPYTADMPHDVRSISKSVVSLLFGIALDQGLIASVDDPVHIYFPDYAALRTPAKDRILLRHLLTMTSGIEWNESRSYYSEANNSEIMMSDSTDPYRFVLEQPVRVEAGKAWNYNGGGTQLLAGVLQRKTGRSLVEFANEALFKPLGITKFEWTKMPANGEAAAASGLRLRPRDMAKIGELVLRKGLWNGHRIVSERWVEQSTRARPDGRPPYGYQWWIGDAAAGDRDASWIAGIGLGGQRIYIVPAHDLVVVITAGLYTDSLEEQAGVADGILDHVLAAIRR